MDINILDQMNSLLGFMQCKSCSEIMEVVNTTADGHHLCVNCIQSENRVDYVVDEAWIKLCTEILSIHEALTWASKASEAFFGVSKKEADNISQNIPNVSESSCSMPQSEEQMKCTEIPQPVSSPIPKIGQKEENGDFINKNQKEQSVPPANESVSDEGHVKTSKTPQEINNLDANIPPGILLDKLIKKCSVTNEELKENIPVNNNSAVVPYTSEDLQKLLPEYLPTEAHNIQKLFYPDEQKGEMATAQEVHSTNEEEASCESEDDLFVPATPKRHSDIKCIVASGISEDPEKEALLKQFADQFNLKLSNVVDNTVDVLLSTKVEGTMKVVFAKSRRIPIIRMSWVNQCLAMNALVPFGRYQLEKVTAPPEFFSRLDLGLCPPFKEGEILWKTILQNAGATATTVDKWTKRAADKLKIIVVEQGNEQISAEQIKILSKTLKAPVVDPIFFANVLMASQLICIKPYYIRPVPDDKMLEWGFPKEILEDNTVSS